jgi:hypothetical protein
MCQINRSRQFHVFAGHYLKRQALCPCPWLVRTSSILQQRIVPALSRRLILLFRGWTWNHQLIHCIEELLLPIQTRNRQSNLSSCNIWNNGCTYLTNLPYRKSFWVIVFIKPYLNSWQRSKGFLRFLQNKNDFHLPLNIDGIQAISHYPFIHANKSTTSNIAFFTDVSL